MKDFKQYFKFVRKFKDRKGAAIDFAHNLFLIGSVLSKKPANVLELGIGTGYVSWSLLHAIRYNRKGSLTCVDTWLDWKGKEPPLANELREAGANIVAPMDEKIFISKSKSGSYDVIVSDADHKHAGDWVDDTLRIAREDAFLFFHDTNQKKYKSLQKIYKRITELKLQHYHFTEKSRDDERCDRGWLFVINRRL
jgi:predicted O-methyltransferase YrrM